MGLPPDPPSLEPLLRAAIDEDLGLHGDVTSLAVLEPEASGEAVIRSKDSGVLAGTFLIAPLFHMLDPTLSVRGLAKDGKPLEKGTEISRISGPLHPILAGERIVLNYLQRLSGIATRTARLVALVQGTRAVVLDTRKTTPGLRFLEKAAVRAGGGGNHRFGLHDMILIKDTHTKACGGPGPAVRRALEYRNSGKDRQDLRIEVEVQTPAEFREALKAGPDRIMLDNMTCEEMTACVRLRDAKVPDLELEASGNISEATIRDVALCGVDFISAGVLTHSVQALDIHLVIL